jgi:tetratricopeptide (TPR) repeat protein
MRALLAASVGLLAFAATVSPAAAQSFDQNKQQCIGGASSDLRVKGCTALIESSQLSGRGLAAVHGLRGNAYLQSRDYDHAIADFSEAIRINPQDAEAFSERGSAYRQEKEDGRAIADYGEAIRLNPQLPGAYYNRGNLHLADKDYDQAIADYDEAIRLSPQFVNALVNRSVAELALGRTAQGEADLAKAQSIDPNAGK